MKKLFLITLFFAALTSLASAEMSMKKSDDAAPAPSAEQAAPDSKPAEAAAAPTSEGAKPKKFVSTNAGAIEDKTSPPEEASPEAAKEE